MVTRDPVVRRCPLELPEADTGLPRGVTVTPVPCTPSEQRAARGQRGMQVRSGRGCRRPELPQPQRLHPVSMSSGAQETGVQILPQLLPDCDLGKLSHL